MPADPALPAAEELAALPHEELAARLADAYRLISELSARVGRLERQAAKDSGTSSRPPSPDSPYKKKPPRDRSLRDKGKRAPGWQPGEPGCTMTLVDNPKYRYWSPAECAGCGTGLEGEPVWAQRRHPGHRHPAGAGARGHRACRAVKGVPVLRRGHRGRAAARGPCPRGVRSRGARAGREPGLRELRPVRPRRRADGRPGRE